MAPPPPGQQPGWGGANPQWQGAPGGGYQAPVPAAPAGPLTQSEERTNALWSHLGSLLVNWVVSCGLLGWIVPLIIRNGAGSRSQYVRFHATESLNFSITVAIASAVSGALIIVLIGILLWPLVAIGALVLQIIASIKANSGEWYRYPVSIRMIND